MRTVERCVIVRFAAVHRAHLLFLRVCHKHSTTPRRAAANRRGVSIARGSRYALYLAAAIGLEESFMNFRKFLLAAAICGARNLAGFRGGAAGGRGLDVRPAARDAARRGLWASGRVARTRVQDCERRQVPRRMDGGRGAETLETGRGSRRRRRDVGRRERGENFRRGTRRDFWRAAPSSV